MKKKDRVARIGLMVTRLGFVVALLLGLGMLAGIVTGGALVPVHMLTGLLVLVGIVIATARFAMLGKGGVPLYIAALLALVGVLQALGTVSLGPQIVHFPLMLLAVGLAEMGSARANRA